MLAVLHLKTRCKELRGLSSPTATELSLNVHVWAVLYHTWLGRKPWNSQPPSSSISIVTEHQTATLPSATWAVSHQGSESPSLLAHSHTTSSCS